MSQPTPASLPGKPGGAPQTIILTGLLAGTLDGLAAIANVYLSSGKGPEVVFRYIASGIFGTEAFSGGTAMIVWGIVFHYIIATSWAALFFILYPRISGIVKNMIVMVILYGVLIWLCMNFIVLPLSRVPQGPFNLSAALLGTSIIILFVALPVVWMVRKYYN